MKKIISIFIISSLVSLFGANKDLITEDPVYTTGCKQIIEYDGVPEMTEALLTYYYIKGVVSTIPIIFKNYELKKGVETKEICSFMIGSKTPLLISIIYLTGSVNGLSEEEIYNIIFK